MALANATETWPALPYAEWRETLDTLHMCSQVVGKLRLTLAPMEPQWRQVPLRITTRGLYSPPLRSGETIFDVDMDLYEQSVRIRAGIGPEAQTEVVIPLTARPVAEFYRDMRMSLADLGIDVDFSERPCEVRDPVPFSEDVIHRTYDQGSVRRFAQILTRTQAALQPYHAAFRGKVSEARFYWGSFDLCSYRFSGRPAEPPAGSGVIMRYAHDAEQFAYGFWPGSARFPEPAFFAYAYPEPKGLDSADLSGTPGFWSPEMGEFMLRYEDVRRSDSPEAVMLAFFEATYSATASLGGWDPDLVRAAP